MRQVNRSNTSSKPKHTNNRKRPTGNTNHTPSTRPNTPVETDQIPKTHPYVAILDGTFSPQGVPAKTWKLAKPVAASILTADYRRNPSRNNADAASRRSALAGYLSWLADTDPELLASDPLDEDEIRRYLASDGRTRRSSYRSRVALRSILNSLCGETKKVVKTSGDPTIEPIEDDLFEKALAECAHFNNPVTRANTRALLLLSRGAGLDGVDLRWVRGSDIVRIPSAGLWVNVPNPENTRSVPVLARFADQLEDLACSRGDRPMLSENGAWPTTPSAPADVASVIARRLKTIKVKGRLNVQALRKAWMAEQLAANAPLLTLLAVTGLKSLRTFDELVTRWAPLPSNNPAHTAYELGGLS